jgi:DNA-binding transcriptional ArsR family regulator
MVKYQDDGLNEIFGALADPTRRAILARLALGETSVGELAEPFEMSLPAVSKHLSVLETAGLVQREKQGRVRRCQLDGRPLEAAATWIGHYRQFWEAQLDSLARYLEETQTQTQPPKGGKQDGGDKRDR